MNNGNTTNIKEAPRNRPRVMDASTREGRKPGRVCVYIDASCIAKHSDTPAQVFNKRFLRRECGFSLIELVIAMAITLVILAAAFGLFKSMADTSSAASQVYDINSDLQASMNLIRRDLRRIDGSDLIIEIGTPLWSATWTQNRCIRNNSLAANCSNTVTGDILIPNATPTTGRDIQLTNISNFALDAITPRIVNGHSAASILYVDDFARDIDVFVDYGSSRQLNIDLTSPSGNQRKFRSIKAGDFVLIQNGTATPIFQHVTGKTDTALSFTASTSPTAVNPTGVNQSSISFGSGGQTVKIHLLRLVTYYLDRNPANGSPAWLMRQVNLHRPEPVVPGVSGFKITYDVADAANGIISEIDISGATLGSKVAGTSYSANAAELISDANYFENDPTQVMNIRRVNIALTDESGTTVFSGNDQKVALAQTSRITVRGYSGKMLNCKPPTPPPPVVKPGDRDGYRCTYTEQCYIECDISCESSGKNCFISFGGYRVDDDPDNTLGFLPPADNAYSEGATHAGWFSQGTLRLDEGNNNSLYVKSIKGLLKPVTFQNNTNNVFWMYYKRESGSGNNKTTTIYQPIPLIWHRPGCKSGADAYFCGDPSWGCNWDTYEWELKDYDNKKKKYDVDYQKYLDDKYECDKLMGLI